MTLRLGRPLDDAGSATILVTGAIAAVVLLLGMLAAFGAVVSTRHRAAVAADLAALAGAAEAVRGPEAGCDRARDIALRNGGSMVACAWAGWEIEVVVARPCGCGPVPGAAAVRARAGPVVEITG